MMAKAPHPGSAIRRFHASRGSLPVRISMGFLSFVFLFAFSLPLSASADTNGPGAPSTTFPFAANQCGPCSDTNTWGLAVAPNIGNGACGRCGDINWQRSTGSCAGTDPGPFNCKAGNCNSLATDRYISTPVGGLVYAGCVAAALAGGIIAELILIPQCHQACIVAGNVFVLSAPCARCIAAQAGMVTTASCTFADCIENCNFMPNRVFKGPVVPCCQ